MKVQIGLSESARSTVVELLNTLLADEYVLYTKTRNFHWNVTGPDFHALHKFFEAQYEQVDGFVDDVAERVRQLGGRALGSLAEFGKATRLKESPKGRPDAAGMVQALLSDHEAVIRALRQDLETSDKAGDEGTTDFLTGLLEQHEKMAWMLRAHLEP
jgi:starvation-inducible DNA-binding protein